MLRHGPTMRLNFGVFVLHALLLAMWVGVPTLLVQAGLPQRHHWWVYLPAVGASFFVMAGTLFPLERRGYLRAVFLTSVGLIGLVQVGLALMAGRADGGGVALLSVMLFIFFCGSNILESTQPSMASRLAPAHSRGTAMGVYEHLAVPGFLRRRRSRRLAVQGLWPGGPVLGLRGSHGRLAAGGLAHARTAQPAIGRTGAGRRSPGHVNPSSPTP